MDWDAVAASLSQTLPLGEKAMGISKEPQRNFWTSLSLLSPTADPRAVPWPYPASLGYWTAPVPLCVSSCVELSDRI